MIIKNGFITDPATQRTGLYDIRIEDGLIKEIAPDLAPEPSEETLDACGLTVAPGLIDTHVHFRDPGFTHKETLHTGALAAAKGGFTSVICMANTSPTVDSVPVLDDILTRAKAEKNPNLSGRGCLPLSQRRRTHRHGCIKKSRRMRLH